MHLGRLKRGGCQSLPWDFVNNQFFSLHIEQSVPSLPPLCRQNSDRPIAAVQSNRFVIGLAPFRKPHAQINAASVDEVRPRLLTIHTGSKKTPGAASTMVEQPFFCWPLHNPDNARD